MPARPSLNSPSTSGPTRSCRKRPITTARDATPRLAANALRVLAVGTGGGGLALLAAFLGGWAPQVVRLGGQDRYSLGSDGLLCLAFFVQHSGMVRRGFRARLARLVPPHCHGAVYSIASGAMLALLVVLWQPSAIPAYALRGVIRMIVRTFSLLALAGFVWSASALRSFDFFGDVPIRARLKSRPERPAVLVVRGPYRWVRHPLYLCVLVLIWARPDVAADRLLFSVLFSVWIVVGTVLEERDLTSDFGDAYRDYRRRVPMLIPWRRRWRPSSAT